MSRPNSEVSPIADVHLRKLDIVIVLNIIFIIYLILVAFGRFLTSVFGGQVKIDAIALAHTFPSCVLFFTRDANQAFS